MFFRGGIFQVVEVFGGLVGFGRVSTRLLIWVNFLVEFLTHIESALGVQQSC